jgi:hypothetical protein
MVVVLMAITLGGGLADHPPQTEEEQQSSGVRNSACGGRGAFERLGRRAAVQYLCTPADG